MIQSESADLKIMNSEILLKIGNFIKKRLIETTGILLLVVAIFLLVSISSYSPGDPNFIYTPENVDIKNWGGFFGSVISDFMLQALGLVSFMVILNLLNWGFKLIKDKKIHNVVKKIFFTFTYIIFATTFINMFYDKSYWLIDNGNGGFVGSSIKENFYLV